MNETRRATLLIVDSDAQALARWHDGFAAAYEVLTARHVPEALQRLQEHRIDVVIAADQLGDTAGIEFLHWVRLRSPDSVRVLTVAAGSAPCAHAAVRRAALFRILARPCPQDLLQETVRQAVRAAQLGGLTQTARDSAGTAAPSPAPALDAGTDDGAGAAPSTAPPGPPSDHETTDSQRLRRVWSSHGITVEEEECEDPVATARLFAQFARPPRGQRPARADEPGASREVPAGGTAPPAASAPATGTGTDVAPSAAEPPPARPRGGAGVRWAGRTGGAAGVARADVLIVSDDAIAAERLRHLAGDGRRFHLAGSLAEAAERICVLPCGIVLLDARRLCESGVSRAARFLRQGAPELLTLVLAPAVEAGDERDTHDDLLDPVLGIVSYLPSPPAGTTLAAALAWCDRLAEAREGNGSGRLPAIAGRDTGQRLTAGSGS